MEDYSKCYISREELLEEIASSINDYAAQKETSSIYSSWVSLHNELYQERDSDGTAFVSKIKGETFMSDQEEHLKKLLGLIKIHERLSLLTELYTRYFDDCDNERLIALKNHIKESEDIFIKPHIKILMNRYPDMLRSYYGFRYVETED